MIDEQIDQFLTYAFQDNGLIEIRALESRGCWSGLFDNPTAIWAAIDRPRSQKFTGIYNLLNAPKLAKPHNNLQPFRQTCKDKDIALLTRLPFDFDPVRPAKNSCSSLAELDAARMSAERLKGYLSDMGWPEPLIGMSGNGFHLQYRVHLRPTPGLQKLLSHLYTGLKMRFSLPEVVFDTTIKNPSRIFKLYGTRSRKGRPTKERPHRLTWCEVPEKWERVSLDQIYQTTQVVIAPERKKIIRTKPVRFGSKGDYKTLDIVSWFKAHNLYKRHLIGKKHAVTCPWSSEHSTPDNPLKTDTIIFESEQAWPVFHCSHDHCANRKIRDVIIFFGDADQFCLQQRA